MTKYDVPYIAQLRTHSCWYACTQMLWQYRHPGFETGATPDFTKRKDGSGDAFSQLLSTSPLLSEEGVTHSGTGATEKDWPILRHLGFREIPCTEVEAIRVPTKDQTQIGMAYAQLESLLQRHGPLWCAGYFFDLGRNNTSLGGHAILLTGVDDQVKLAGSAKRVVYFNDPAASNGGSKDKRKLFDWFRTALFNTTDESEGISPMWHLPVSQTALANWSKLREAVKSGAFKGSGTT